jgi:hypothetical protein
MTFSKVSSIISGICGRRFDRDVFRLGPREDVGGRRPDEGQRFGRSPTEGHRRRPHQDCRRSHKNSLKQNKTKINDYFSE